MNLQYTADEYTQALKQGQRVFRERTAAGLDPHPPVLDDLLQGTAHYTTQELGTLEVPAERVVGTKTRGRISAFAADFLPLLGTNTEFAQKWMSLCAIHLGSEGIRDAVECYEYLGNFYVEEGNKRVSILRWFGAPRILCHIKRILPQPSDDPRVKAYYEFLEFYKAAKTYTVQFRHPGDYGKLLEALGRSAEEPWTEDERRVFRSAYYRFQECFRAMKVRPADVLPEEALLVWLQLYSFDDLRVLSDAVLKRTIADLWKDMVTATTDSVTLQTHTQADTKASFWAQLVTPGHVNVAFVHQLPREISAWVQGHEEGVRHLEAVFGERVTARSYFDAHDDALGEALLEQAVEDGAQVVFSTAPALRRVTLKAAVKYPNVRFLNCSVDQPYASVRSYYGRIYEAKFITGAIAGIMARDGRIGYIASNPIFGVPASINAFALGAQMTNPEAVIHLRWACCGGAPQEEFFREGIRVISNRDVPTQWRMNAGFCNYGTYLLEGDGTLSALASPVWLWGKFYEFVVHSILSGTWKEQKEAVNYWLGMDSGVIDIRFTDKLPQGVRILAELLRKNICDGTLDPFRRSIRDQDGTVRSDGERLFDVESLLHMNWLCENVEGSIPAFDQVLPSAQSLVRELGIYRDAPKGGVL